jgi:broad specificity phosphatase PhoE
MELAVVRHGRTEWNAQGRFQGQIDVPLDASGRAQALALEARLRAEPFEVAVASDLLRARHTAETILVGRGLPLQLDPRWREMAFGAWEGLTWDEILRADPSLRSEDGARPSAYAPPGGETFAVLCARVAAALADLRASGVASALIVTHAGPLHALLQTLLGARAPAVRFTPASVTRLRLTDGGAELVTLNESAVPASVAADDRLRDSPEA